MKKYILSLFTLFFSMLLCAQEFSSFEPSDFSRDTNYGYFSYVQLNYFRGGHLAAEKYKQALSESYSAFELRLGIQSSGRQDWQRLHKYPSYGLGVFGASLGSTDVDSVLGTPSGVYFFYSEPWFRFWKITFLTDLAIGLSYDFNPYDNVENASNTLVGSRTNLYFNINFMFYYELSRRLDLSLGANFFHFSNGRMYTPQSGINMGGLNVGMRYNFNSIKNYTKYSDPDYQPPVRPEFIRSDKGPIDRFGEVQFTLAPGTVLSEPGDYKNENGDRDTSGYQQRYLTTTFSVEYAYKFVRKMKAHVGLDAFYDGSLEYTYPEILPQNVDVLGRSSFGAHVGFQYLIERFAFYYSLGWYIYKETPDRGNWYMRAGGRIGITEDLDAHIALKTRNGGIADWIEWGLAYKIKVHK